jgi:hypothetical protein
MLAQFTAAFDDCFVWRLNKAGEKIEKIKVRYVNGPKQRVLYDIVNQAKNITIPAISIEQKNIKRDPTRVQNKGQNIYRKHINGKKTSKIPQPIPIIFDLDVSIIANFKEDIDQIASNIIPWCNPYFIISLKIPEDFGLDFDDEIRSDVNWSGSIEYENPTEVESQDKFRIIGNTSFTVKGWLFPSLETPVEPIYVINSNFHAVETGADLYSYDSYPTLSGIDHSTTDNILISAYPEFTNTFINGRIYRSDIEISSDNENIFTVYGKRFDFKNKWYLSSNEVVPGYIFEEIQTIKFPLISGYRIPDTDIEIANDNIAILSLSSGLVISSPFTLITSNSAGWVSSKYNILVI